MNEAKDKPIYVIATIKTNDCREDGEPVFLSKKDGTAFTKAEIDEIGNFIEKCYSDKTDNLDYPDQKAVKHFDWIQYGGLATIYHNGKDGGEAYWSIPDPKYIQRYSAGSRSYGSDRGM